jgi:hypothetical protein
MRRTVLTVFAFLLAAAPAHARPGDLDRTFANGGRAAFSVFGNGGAATGLALPDGRRPLLAVSSYRDGRVVSASLRLTTSGRISSVTDAAGGSGNQMFANGYSLTRLTVAAGAAQAFSVARVGSDDDVTIALPAPDRTVTAFGVDRARRVLLLGWTRSNERTFAFVTRYRSTGSIDTGYGDGGTAQLGELFSETLHVRSDGRAFIADGTRIIALGRTGHPVRGYRTDTLRKVGVSYSQIHAIATGPGETLLVGGDGAAGWLARVRGDGRLDRRFGDVGALYGSGLRAGQVNVIARDRRGRIVVGGRGTDFGHATVLRLSARGRVDRSFGSNGAKSFVLGLIDGERIEQSSADYLAFDDRDRIVVAGQVYDDEYDIRDDQGRPYPAIARLKG